jgi:multiple sugar transport system permease protein
MASKPLRVRPAHIAAHLILLVTTVALVAPFLWMISTSLKEKEAIFKVPGVLLQIPLYLENYKQVFALMPTVQATINSFKIASLNTIGTLLTSSLAAYAFAKIPFRGKSKFFAIFLATIMIPGQITLIPLYILFSRIGWIDTHLPLMVPFILLNAYGVFLLRQFMEGIPNDYLESARIDGANHFQIYLHIILPLCKPALITLGLLSFIGNWNNFIGPLIFLNTDTKFTLPLIINSFRTIYYVDWGLLMAAACVAIVPVTLLYLVARKFITEGISLAGLKG